ncbi:P-loop NTPase fold protein [Catenovulum adriaticum]|uniref:KAP family NTPase n=1 Tax=Catenovulum adriaticum TaxID=2984846 RepID=A0ABY7AI77_9ALTE|nr:P-loop NTPase fold protein [Catenovulum sp. TS8]WAJ69159.1 KAP family NTPase [Catenovulum sp. TS8]
MASPAEQIKHLLEDNSFPSMVKLDGDWGSGKTYYTKHTLNPELKRISNTKNIIYFSLFGLSSLNDFRDKLISASYLSDKADPNWIGQVKDSALGIFKAFDTDNAGTIGNILKTSSGAIKHALMARLENLIVVLDDLERLNDTKFQEQIIGECLHFAEENKFSFIFVLNSAELNLNNSLLEKAFSGKVKFSHNTEELFKIAFEPYGDLLDFKPQLIRLIEKYELKNLRVLKRVAYKLKYIYSQIKDIPDVDLDVTIAGFAKDLIRISCLHYKHEKSVKEIYSALGNKSIKAKIQAQPNAIQKTNEQDEFYNRYRDYYPPTEKMVSYCCNETQLTMDINELGKIVLNTNLIAQLLFNHSSLYRDDFNYLLTELNNLRFKKENVPIKRWFEACQFYIYLIEHNFIDDKNISKFINMLKKDVNKKEFYRDTENQYHTFKLYTPDISNLYEEHSAKLEAEDSKISDDELFDKIKVSWANVHEEVEKKFSTSCFLNKYTEKKWFITIKNWHLKEIECFTDFIRERYRAQNIKRYLKDELPVLQKLHQLIHQEIDSLHGQKAGLFTLLNNVIYRGITQLSVRKDG